MKRTITVSCPYCGTRVNVSVTNDYRQKRVITCDAENGGCDKDFVVAAEVSIKATALKIEGEAEE